MRKRNKKEREREKKVVDREKELLWRMTPSPGIGNSSHVCEEMSFSIKNSPIDIERKKREKSIGEREGVERNSEIERKK